MLGVDRSRRRCQFTQEVSEHAPLRSFGIVTMLFSMTGIDTRFTCHDHLAAKRELCRAQHSQTADFARYRADQAPATSYCPPNHCIFYNQPLLQISDNWVPVNVNYWMQRSAHDTFPEPTTRSLIQVYDNLVRKLSHPTRK
jgi:hypothetical protein